MAYFPMFTDLTNRWCLIVGGGKTAQRKLEVLMDFGANVMLASRAFSKEIEKTANECPERIRLFQSIEALSFVEKKTEEEEIALVIAASSDHELNHRIAGFCKCRHIPVNAVDQIEDCSFIFPSYLKQKDLVAAFSSAGKSPLITQYLKNREKDVLTPFLGEINECLGSIREAVRSSQTNETERKKIYREILEECLETEYIPSCEELEKMVWKRVNTEKQEEY